MPARPGELHQVPADEEELGETGPFDDLELVGQLADDRRRHRVVAPTGTLMAELGEVRERGLAAGHREPREAICLELEIDPAGCGQLDGIGDPLDPGPGRSRVRGRPGAVTGRQRRELIAGLEVRLPVGAAQVGQRPDRAAVADGGDHVLELASLGQGVVDVIGDDHGEAELLGQAGRLGHEPVVVGQQVVLELEDEACRRDPVRRRPRSRPSGRPTERSALDDRPGRPRTAGHTLRRRPAPPPGRRPGAAGRSHRRGNPTAPRVLRCARRGAPG